MSQKKYTIYAMVSLIILLGLLYAYWQNLHEDEPQQGQTPLQQAGNACDMIATKAAAHLPENLPFQKLEKAARQSRVLGICMNDRGYEENPAWVAYVANAVKRASQQQSISENEAFESIKREAMLKFKESNAEPNYWRIKPSAKH